MAAPEKFDRHSIRLRGYDYSQAGGYYITIVSSGREHLFGEVVESRIVLNQFGQIAKTQWERLPRRFRHIELGEFAIMPNHIHGIIYIVDGSRGTAELSEEFDYESTRRALTVDESTRRALTVDESSRRALTVDESSRRAPTDDESPHHTEQFGKPIPGSIPTIIRSYKSAVALRVNLSRQYSGNTVWQRNYYEHIIRNQADYERIAGYILNNPANWNQDVENPAGKRDAPM